MQTYLPFTVRCYSSRYLPIAANEPEVSSIDLLLRLGIRWNNNGFLRAHKVCLFFIFAKVLEVM